MRRVVIAAIGVTLLASGCDVIRVAEYTHHFDANRGDVVIVVMDDSTPGWEQRCLDMGGKPEFDADGVPTCFDTDF